MSIVLPDPFVYDVGDSLFRAYVQRSDGTKIARTRGYVSSSQNLVFSAITVIEFNTLPITYLITFESFGILTQPTVKVTDLPTPIITASESLGVTWRRENGGLIIEVTLNPLKRPVLSYVDGDVYTIYLNQIRDGQKGIRVVVSRAKKTFQGLGGGFSTLPEPSQISPTGPVAIQPLRVPIIDIYGQTTLNGEYLSDMTFVIQDQYKYKCPKNIVDPCPCGCDIYYIQPNQLKTTTLMDNNIPLEDVVIGKGTLQDKVDRIATSRGEPNFKLFYERFIRYAMLKYILIRLLYGEYDLNKLCRNYNKQFFKDLKHSRFCGFIEFFEDPANDIIGFEQYFIKC